MSNDYYRLLGVDRRTSSEALRRAFREQIKHVHPDHNPGDATACERTRDIVEAYRVLSNPRSRRQHDISLTQSAPLFKVSAEPQRPLLHPFLARILTVCVFIMVGLLAAVITGAITDNRPVLARADLPGTQSWRSEEGPTVSVGLGPGSHAGWYHALSCRPVSIDTSSVSGMQIPYAKGVQLVSNPGIPADHNFPIYSCMRCIALESSCASGLALRLEEL